MKPPPPWSTGPGSTPAAPPPRARSVETGEPIPRLKLKEKAILFLVAKLGRPLIQEWLPRQLLKWLSVVSAMAGAGDESTQGTVAWCVSVAALLLEMALSWLHRRFLKLKR